MRSLTNTQRWIGKRKTMYNNREGDKASSFWAIYDKKMHQAVERLQSITYRLHNKLHDVTTTEMKEIIDLFVHDKRARYQLMKCLSNDLWREPEILRMIDNIIHAQFHEYCNSLPHILLVSQESDTIKYEKLEYRKLTKLGEYTDAELKEEVLRRYPHITAFNQATKGVQPSDN